MTWSVVARDASGAFGVAVASRFFAVGAHCPHARSGVGALCTQALVNPAYGPRGLSLLEKNLSGEQAVAELISSDEGREHRQVHLVDRHGGAAAHTGQACVDWCGHRAGPGFSVAGNMLSGAAVLERTAEEFAARHELPFALRLIAALAAGEAAGGDKRGKQSAALLINEGEEWSALDLRVDDHADPLAELKRLERVSRERWMAFRKFLPTRQNPAGITDRAIIDAAVAAANAGET